MQPPFTLEPRTADHAEALYPLLVDPALTAFLGEAPPVSVEVLRVRYARTETRRSPDGSEHWLNWVVRDAAGRIAGFLQATVEADGATNVAYLLGTPWQGRGLATRAVERMLAELATRYGATRLYIVADRRNLASLRLARRLGFTDAAPEVTARRGVLASDQLLERAARVATPAP